MPGNATRRRRNKWMGLILSVALIALPVFAFKYYPEFASEYRTWVIIALILGAVLFIYFSGILKLIFWLITLLFLHLRGSKINYRDYKTGTISYTTKRGMHNSIRVIGGYNTHAR